MKFIAAFSKLPFLILSKLFGSFSWSPPPWISFLKNFYPNIKNLCSRIVDGLRSSSSKIRSLTGRVFSSVSKIRAISLRKMGVVLGVLALVAVLIILYTAGRRGLIHVSGTTPELTKLEDVLKPDPVRISFSGSAARLDLIGKPVTQGDQRYPRHRGRVDMGQRQGPSLQAESGLGSGTEVHRTHGQVPVPGPCQAFHLFLFFHDTPRSRRNCEHRILPGPGGPKDQEDHRHGQVHPSRGHG